MVFNSRGPFKEELYLLANNLLEHPKTLIEMPLVLIPQDMFQISEDMYRDTPLVNSTLKTWISRAKSYDECLRIERQWIPFAETYLPDTPEGRQFFNIANTFGEIPIASSVIPHNQNQGYWLKTLHHFYQARGILFAYKLLGVISNPTAEDGCFTHHLSTTNIRNLEIITSVDLAEYELIKQGEPYIQQWAENQGITYPFESPLDLFFEIAKQSFLEAWMLGPNSKEINWVTIEQQQDLFAVRIRLLEQTPWLNQQTKRKTRNQRGTYQEQEANYLEFLRTAGWYGHLVLSLRPKSSWNLEKPWKNYTDALRQGKLAYLDDFYWRNGQPYRNQEVTVAENAPKTRKTASHQPVKGTTNFLGYILWIWS